MPDTADVYRETFDRPPSTRSSSENYALRRYVPLAEYSLAQGATVQVVTAPSYGALHGNTSSISDTPIPAGSTSMVDATGRGEAAVHDRVYDRKRTMQDGLWVGANRSDLYRRYGETYIAVLNKRVVETHANRFELCKLLRQRGLLESALVAWIEDPDVPSIEL